jgi:hypothetical protein
MTGARRDWVAAGLLAAVGSGVPSTVVALARGEDVLDGARAAGAIVLPDEARTIPLLVAAAPVHLALSLGWAYVIARGIQDVTPARGVAAGLAIAALDLGVIGRRIPAIRALPQPRQWADHAAYGLIVGAWLSAARAHGRGPR